MKKQSRANQHAALRRKWRTDGTYERLLFAQHNRCGICRKERELDVETQKWERFDIDHHHAKGKDTLPRGLLCRGCNLRLGRESDERWLRRAAYYLSRTA
jgi:hypothetical protein